MRFYCGLDVHSATSTFCLLDQRGKELETVTLTGGWDRLLEPPADGGGAVGWVAGCSLCHRNSL